MAVMVTLPDTLLLLAGAQGHVLPLADSMPCTLLQWHAHCQACENTATLCCAESDTIWHAAAHFITLVGALLICVDSLMSVAIALNQRHTLFQFRHGSGTRCAIYTMAMTYVVLTVPWQ